MNQKTVMIVDDERPARELLKLMTNWSSLDFNICYDTGSPLDALNYYTNFMPDLIFTDIQMPQMNGLEFIKRIRQINPAQKIIVLSCHEEFQYAREALQLQVLDYLIKDQLTEETLISTIRTHFNESSHTLINNEGSSLKRSNDFSKLIQSYMSKHNTSSFISSLTPSNLGESFAYFIIDINLPESFSICSCSYQELIYNSCYTLDNFYGGATCLYHENNLFILCFMPKYLRNSSYITLRYDIISNIRYMLSKNQLLSIGVSSMSYNLDNIDEIIKEATTALSCRIFVGNNKILYYDSLKDTIYSPQSKILKLRLEELKSALKDMLEDDVIQTINTLYSKDLQGIIQINYITYINQTLINTLSWFCINCGLDPLSLDLSINPDTICSLESIEDMKLWQITQYKKVFSYLNPAHNYSNLKVREIIKYISNHYQEDISLDSIASSYSIHKTHLSRLFKQETGKNLHQYIREVRIDASKILLKDCSNSIQEIIDSVGFKSSQNFYTIFKKIVGITPLEYRNQICK